MISWASPYTRRTIGSVSLINVLASAKCPSSMSEFATDVAVAMRLADFVLEGPTAIGLKRTDPEAVPQRMYTSDYDSASGAEEHEEAAAATTSPTTHST